MNATTNQIAANDQIVATLEINGKTIARVTRDGFTGIEDVVRTLKALAGGFIGLARVNIRNKSRGWNVLKALVSRNTPTPRVQYSGTVLPLGF